MRALLLLAGLLALPACSDPGAPVAAVAGQTLSAERLAHLMVLAQPMPLTPQAASELASHWVTLMAFGMRMATGDSMLDSTTVADLMRYPIRQEMLGEWRRRLLARIPLGEAGHFDSTYARELLRTRHARLAEDGPALLREIAGAPWGTLESTRVLATFDGGAVPASRLQQYVQYVTPATRLDIRAATDDRIAVFLWGFVLDELLAAQAESAGVVVGEEAYRAMSDACREVVHTLWARADLSPASLTGTGPTVDDRARAAARRVEAYLEAAVARRLPLDPLPPFLAVPLLRDVEWEITAERMDGAVERARRLLAAAGRPGEP
jgi:hypothetical protein